MGADTSWRIDLRTYLTARTIAGQEITLGELLDRFGDQVPLHTAARQGRRGRSRTLTPDRMRRDAILLELSRIDCSPGRRGKFQPRDTVVVVKLGRCAICAIPFVAKYGSATCGKTCGGKFSHRLMHPPLLAAE